MVEAICFINTLLLRSPLSRCSNFVPIVVGGGQPGWLQRQSKTWAPGITWVLDAANTRDGSVPKKFCLAVGSLRSTEIYKSPHMRLGGQRGVIIKRSLASPSHQGTLHMIAFARIGAAQS